MNTQLFLEGMEVDLTDVINIPLNKSFEDLSNPTNINNEFSKTIHIPVCAKNNEILGKAFRLDRVLLAYNDGETKGAKNIGQFLNPTRKIPFKLMCNGDLIMEGYSKLSLIDNSYDSKFYTLNLFGTLGDLFHKLINVAVNIKFCPELSLDEIWEDQSHQKLWNYAIALNPITDEVDDEPDTDNPGNYKWRDVRYLMDDCLSGKKRVCAKDIKDCWETPVDIDSTHDLTTIQKDELDWQIVGLMPSHHGFPDNFDPKAFERKNTKNDYTETVQFTDEANEVGKKDSDDGGVGLDLDHSSLVGDGLTEEQLQQFVSWQQKPYIYINKLFALFQKHMNEHPDLFDGYKLEIDPVWEKVDNQNKYINPFWSNLCYTFDFLFNKDIESKQTDYDIILDDNIMYKHIRSSEDKKVDGVSRGKTNTLGLKTGFTINYEEDNVINNVTLNGYICVALPCYHSLDEGSTGWCAQELSAGKYIYQYRSGYNYATNAPELFFTHYLKTKDYDAGAKQFCNGGYMVTIKVFDENDNLLNTIKNSWSPLHVKNYDKNSYKGKMTRNLKDKNIVNGQIIDIVKETDPDKAAVLLHRTFKGEEVLNNKLKRISGATQTTRTENYFIGVGLPLRSFGSIPVGVRNPHFEITVELMSERWKAGDDDSGIRIDDDYQFTMGCYTGIDPVSNNYIMRKCSLDSVLFPYRSDWEEQQDESNYITMFFQKFDNTVTLQKYRKDYYSSDAYLRTFLLNEGDGRLNGYGRYSSLVSKLVYERYNEDSLLYDRQNDGVIHIGQETTFSSTGQFIDNNHSPIIKLENLWLKEEGLFNILIEYSKIYGLFWIVDNYNKKIKLLTRRTYFDKYTIEDWSNKIDKSKDFQITPILHASKYLNFDYEDEKDAMHYSMYGENYLVNYGGYRLKTGYEFTPESEDLFKGIQSTCMSNRAMLTWNQIKQYNPKQLPYVTTSPFTMMDADSKDGKKPIEIENWIFRNVDNVLYTTEEENSDKFEIGRDGDSQFNFLLVDDTPTMTATQKYMYLDADRCGNDYYGHGADGNSGLGVAIPCTVFPNFNNVCREWGCLFAAPAEDYTIPNTNTNVDGIVVRKSVTPLISAKDNGKWVYKYAWERWMNERYNVNNKKLTCYVDLKPYEFVNITPYKQYDNTEANIPNDVYFSNFKLIDGQLFILNKIIDFNPLGSETTKCEFVQITDVDVYRDETLESFGEFSLKCDERAEIDKGTDGIYHITDSETTSFMADYGSIPFENVSALPIVIHNSPASDARLYTFDKKLATLIDVTKPTEMSMQVSSLDIPESDFNNTRLETTREAYLKPYFTWFINDGAGNERFINFRGENVTELGDTITFGIKNIKSIFKSLELSTGANLRWVDNETQKYTDTITLFNNLGLGVTYDYFSFYEIPLLCKKHGTSGISGEEASEVRNIILPTSNRCVDFDNGSVIRNAMFNHRHSYTCLGKDMYDSINSDVIQNIINDIKNAFKYDTVELLPTADDLTVAKDGKARLYTTIVWHLEGSPISEYANETSILYAFEYVDDEDKKPMLYAGKGTNKIHKDLIIEEFKTLSQTTPFLFGCGDNTRYNSFRPSAEFESVMYNNFGNNYVYTSRAVSSSQFYNTQTTRPSVKEPELGKCRIIDMYNEFNWVPFLTDLDSSGEDGYVYQTYYQELDDYDFETTRNWHINIGGLSSIPTYGGKYISPANQDSTYNLTVNLRKGASETVTGDYSLEYEVAYPTYTDFDGNVIDIEPYETDENKITLTDDGNGNVSIIIPANTTGYERYITITIKWNNTLMEQTFTITQKFVFDEGD